MKTIGIACTAGFLLVGAMLSIAQGQDRFDLRQYMGWKIAICYHPMYLLIDEDRGKPSVGERVPPWGASKVEDYVGRVRRNLESLEKDPSLTLNYEWSAYELEDLARRFPDVAQRMKALYEKGQLDFIGGEFSQPHAAILGSESCWRQFEMGLEVFQRLFGKKMTVDATQETQVHPQLPQLLRHFGYEYMVMPPFPAAVRIDEGPFEMLYQHGAPRVKRGDEFIQATAPDGSAIPAYFPSPGDANFREETIRDLWGCPPLLITFPDMEEYHNPQAKFADPVLLHDALRKRFQVAPPRAKGQVHTYWSYTEGTWAEEHLRNNRAAEEAAVLAGNVAAMANLARLGIDKQADLKSIWHSILKYQHHDVAWNEVTDLRRKAIDADKKNVDDSRKLMAEFAAGLVEKKENSLAIFNGAARARKAILDVSADQIPAGDLKFQKIGDRFLGVREVVAGGFKSYPLRKDGWTQSKPSPLPSSVSTDFYSAEFSENGLIKQITTADGKQLLASGKYLGGEMRAVIADEWVNNRAADARFYEGDVCYVMERAAKLGHIPVTERYFFFRHEPTIKVEVEFDFKGDEVGNFHIDETKINIYYPTTRSEIYHDAPFAYASARENEPILASNWMYCGGLLYVNRGTPKHWVRDAVMANTVAWGGNQFSNRLSTRWLATKRYDLRLYGKQKIEYFLIPFGPFDAARVVQAAEAVTAPVFVTAGSGTKSLYAVKDNRLVLTGIYENEGQVWARGYKLPDPQPSQFHDWQIFNVPLRNLQ